VDATKNINASFHGLFLKEALHNSRFARYHFHHQQSAINKNVPSVRCLKIPLRAVYHFQK
jgi:hypothetical protein